jgi:hypothetical protein
MATNVIYIDDDYPDEPGSIIVRLLDDGSVRYVEEGGNESNEDITISKEIVDAIVKAVAITAARPPTGRSAK